MGSRSSKVRFEVVSCKGFRLYIGDDDFHWDALLRVSGDFEDDAAKARYAQAICDVLNANEHLIPTAPADDSSTSAGEKQK